MKAILLSFNKDAKIFDINEIDRINHEVYGLVVTTKSNEDYAGYCVKFE